MNSPIVRLNIIYIFGDVSIFSFVPNIVMGNDFVAQMLSAIPVARLYLKNVQKNKEKRKVNRRVDK